jgi:3-phosphoshikimate 1-carboxyvinyltransferase
MAVASQVNRVVVIGLGLIGGSLALALKKNGFCREVIGIDSSPEALLQGCALGVIDIGVADIGEITPPLDANDIVYLSVPTLAVAGVLAHLKGVLSSEVTLTDGASVKGSVVKALEQHYGEVPSQFVLGHPIAGSEKSGVTAAVDHLFEQRRCILCPTATTATWHLNKVTAMWQSAGAAVHLMTDDVHDHVFAATSHLPHVIAFCLVDTLAGSAYSADVFENAAGGFKEFTRVASSDPRMWRDICLANSGAIVERLDCFINNLTALRQAMLAGDGDTLQSSFARAKKSRDNFLCAQ